MWDQAAQLLGGPVGFKVGAKSLACEVKIVSDGDRAVVVRNDPARQGAVAEHELVRTLEPYVRSHTGHYVEFAAAVRSAVAAHLPELGPHIEDVVRFLVLYYGVTDAPQLTP